MWKKCQGTSFISYFYLRSGLRSRIRMHMFLILPDSDPQVIAINLVFAVIFKVNDGNSRLRIHVPHGDPDPLVRGIYLRIRIHPQNVLHPQHSLQSNSLPDHRHFCLNSMLILRLVFYYIQRKVFCLKLRTGSNSRSFLHFLKLALNRMERSTLLHLRSMTDKLSSSMPSCLEVGLCRRSLPFLAERYFFTIPTDLKSRNGPIIHAKLRSM